MNKLYIVIAALVVVIAGLLFHVVNMQSDMTTLDRQVIALQIARLELQTTIDKKDQELEEAYTLVLKLSDTKKPVNNYVPKKVDRGLADSLAKPKQVHFANRVAADIDRMSEEDFNYKYNGPISLYGTVTLAYADGTWVDGIETMGYHGTEGKMVGLNCLSIESHGQAAIASDCSPL